MKKLNDFEITDQAALVKEFPQFFKQIPDIRKIRAALKLGIDLPGVSLKA